MQGLDPNFNASTFLGGADQAFRMIVSAFAAGDRTALRSLLSDDTYHAFEQAITAREAAGHTQVSEVRAIQSLALEGAELKGTTSALTVRIVSDQVSYTLDQARHPITGTEAVTEITDLWTFERDLKAQDPTWRLVAARSA
jgi:predicted lipid-binding transport protein (Tim44 family)